MTRRAEFTRKTKLAAWEQSGGCCADCGRKIFPGDGPEYDHIIAAEHGGGNELSNCQVLCAWCHKPKTRADMAKTVKGRKVRAAHAGAKTLKRPMPGSRASGLRKRIDGTVERRGRE